MAIALRHPATEARVQGIDHVTISTADCAAAKALYARALAPLGFAVVFDWPDGGRAHLGLPAERSRLWLVEGAEPARAALSLAAADRPAVDAFYAAALAAGASPVSAPAYRPEYTATTYAATIRDPDGNTIEAICRHARPLPGAERAA
jgi:catechol 2,3-dioxygenase-like lactoylglutathione lyase family enzyme